MYFSFDLVTNKPLMLNLSNLIHVSESTEAQF